MCLSTIGKKFPLIKVNRQALSKKFETWTNLFWDAWIKFWASAYLFKFIDQLATKNMTQALDFLFGAPSSNLDSLLTATFFRFDDVVVSFCLLRDQLMHAKLLYQHKSNNATMLKPWYLNAFFFFFITRFFLDIRRLLYVLDNSMYTRQFYWWHALLVV